MVWKECFEKNATMLHVDISHNNLSLTEIEVIHSGLINNHTILGLHMLGNEGETDTQGFVKASARGIQESNCHVFTRILPTFKGGAVHNKKLMELKTGSNCWICEGWS